MGQVKAHPLKAHGVVASTVIALPAESHIVAVTANDEYYEVVLWTFEPDPGEAAPFDGKPRFFRVVREGEPIPMAHVLWHIGAVVLECGRRFVLEVTEAGI